MSETESNQQLSTREQSKAGKRYFGAMVVTLLIATLMAFIWYQGRTLRQQNKAIEAQLQNAMATLEKSEREQRATLSAETRERDQVLASRQESLEQEMQGIRDQLGRSRSEWLAAESGYLLRVANRRLLLEHDVRGALIALRSADSLLAEGANPFYLPVREQLRGEIQSLEAITPVDVDGIALELSGLSKQLDTLPLMTEPHEIGKNATQNEQTAQEGSVIGRFFGAMWNSIKGMVSVRRLDQKALPLLPPEQRFFLTQNLRLRLEMARFALLRGDLAIYQENLKTAASWLDTYYDKRDAAVKKSHEAVARLAQINIAPALPEIGASLRTLERISDKKGGARPAAGRGR